MTRYRVEVISKLTGNVVFMDVETYSKKRAQRIINDKVRDLYWVSKARTKGEWMGWWWMENRHWLLSQAKMNKTFNEDIIKVTKIYDWANLPRWAKRKYEKMAWEWKG